jgi:hypothetical protein
MHQKAASSWLLLGANIMTDTIVGVRGIEAWHQHADIKINRAVVCGERKTTKNPWTL